MTFTMNCKSEKKQIVVSRQKIKPNCRRKYLGNFVFRLFIFAMICNDRDVMKVNKSKTMFLILLSNNLQTIEFSFNIYFGEIVN